MKTNQDIRIKKLSPWVVQVIIENPNIFDNAKTSIEVISRFFDEWAKDIQPTLRFVIKESLKNKN